MPVCESKPRVYWLACAAVATGWLVTFVQGIMFMSAINFRRKGQQVIINKHDWEKRFVHFL